MAVPNTFAADTGSIPLADLDANFSYYDTAYSIVSTAVTFNGVVSHPAGTALLPTITNNGDTNTGIFFPATDTVGISTNGSERMRIDSSGNVGIGTSSPSTYSNVYKTVNAIKINDQVTTIGSYYQAGVAQYGFINVSDTVGTTAQPLVFSNGSNVERMRIDSVGNVLVTNPAGLGYGSGSGGTVTQGAGSGKATPVTLNKPTGQITMNNAALAASTTVSFNLTNSLISATDNIIVTLSGGVTSQNNYNMWAYPQAGSAAIQVRNISGGSLSESVLINFAIIKGATS